MMQFSLSTLFLFVLFSLSLSLLLVNPSFNLPRFNTECVCRSSMKRYVDTNDDNDGCRFRNALLDRNACSRYDELPNPLAV